MRRLTTSLVPLAFVLATIIIVAGIIVPSIRTITTIRNVTIAEHAALERRYQQGRVLSRVLREFAESAPRLAAIRERIPLERDALAFVQQIERVASARALREVVAIERGSMTLMDGGIIRIPVTIDLEGSYPELIAALRDFERLPLPPAITHLKFMLTDERTTATPSRVQLTIRAATVWRTGR